MILSTKETEFLKRNKYFIESIFKKRIEDLKEQILNEDDEDKRNKKIYWAREMKTTLGILQSIDKEKGKEDTGI